MNTAKVINYRITSIDLLRGLVMIIMTLDHTRDFFHNYSHYFEPTDLNHTTVPIFITRWITHICAPIFVLLSGVSAYLQGLRKSKKELSVFLVKRGLWLMLLELTLVNFGWLFNPAFNLQLLQVIWALGISMVVLGALVHLPFKAILILGIVLVCGHNLLDNIHVPGNSLKSFAWSQLHEFNILQHNGLIVITAYPVIPWIGVMALGYCLGKIYGTDYSQSDRKRILIRIGGLGILLFIIIRFFNIYGDPHHWQSQTSFAFTILSFLNTTKYPPSLLYLLMTLSPALLFLALAENTRGTFSNFIRTYGRVPLIYYLLHIYVLHLFALLAAASTGYHWEDMVFTNSWITQSKALRGYGFSLPVVYLVWLATVIILYPLCTKYGKYKLLNRTKWWLSYL